MCDFYTECTCLWYAMLFAYMFIPWSIDYTAENIPYLLSLTPYDIVF
jgi:hypothetical protein